MVREHPLRNRTQRKVEPLHETGMQPAIPFGLGMALVQNLEAMERFTALSHDNQQAFIASASAVHSKEEMRRLVEGLTK